MALAANSWLGWLLMLRKPGTWKSAFAMRTLGAIALFIPVVVFGYPLLPAAWLSWEAQLLTLLFVVVGVLFQKLRKRDETDVRVYGYLYTAPPRVDFVLAEIAGWTMYLYAYELLFRGLILNVALTHLHWLPAFLIVNVIYALAHIQQGWRETTASFFAGWVFGGLVWWTNNFIIAFVIHLVLALANSYFMAKATWTMANRSKTNTLGHVG